MQINFPSVTDRQTDGLVLITDTHTGYLHILYDEPCKMVMCLCACVLVCVCVCVCVCVFVCVLQSPLVKPQQTCLNSTVLAGADEYVTPRCVHTPTCVMRGGAHTHVP